MLTQRLPELRERLLRRAMEDRRILLRAAGPEGLERADLAGIAHRLAGAGGTVGLPAISDAAFALEDACETRDADAVRTTAQMLCDAIAEAASSIPLPLSRAHQVFIPPA